MPRLNFLKSPFFWKISLSNVCLVIIISLGFSYAIFFQSESSLEEDARTTLLQKAALVEPLAREMLKLEEPRSNQIANDIAKNASVRLTLISPSGTVLIDTEQQASALENHSDRPEILQAKASGAGFARRFSWSMKKHQVYGAKRIDDDKGKLLGFIRLAYPDSAITSKLAALQWSVALAALVGILFTIILGTILARSITIPLSQMQEVCNAMRAGDYQQKVKNLPTDEIGLLGKTLNHLSVELTDKIAALNLEKTQMRTTLAGMVEGLISLDHNGTIRFCNQSAYNLLHSPETDCRGKKLGEVEGFAKLEDLVNKVDTKSQFLEQELKVKTGEFYKTLEIRINYFKKPDAEGYLVLLHDISHLRQLERVRRDFVANVSHELKTPLTAIKGYSETLLDGAIDNPEFGRRFVDKINRNSQHLTDIVADLLNLASLESMETEVQTHPVQIDTVISSVLTRYEDALAEKGIEVETQISQGSKVLADDESITLIFDNLISNAIRYSPNYGRIRITTQTDDDKLITSVADTGIGIPEKDLHKVFERFYRVDKARSKKLGGTGLGLSIVKHLVVRMGGDVAVKSVLGVGSEFRVTLPSM